MVPVEWHIHIRRGFAGRGVGLLYWRLRRADMNQAAIAFEPETRRLRVLTMAARLRPRSSYAYTSLKGLLIC